MNSRLPPQIDNPKNRAVLSYLAPLSCHSDMVEPIDACLKRYADVAAFCPALCEFRYVVWYRGDTVFAFAEVMQNVTLRVADLSSINHGVGDGHEHGELNGWLSFRYNDRQLCDWVHVAYSQSKNT